MAVQRAGWIEVGSGGTAGAQYNVIENFGFEATTYNEDWTASGGVVAEATGTNIIFGEKSATWDASASTQTFSYASLAIGQGYKSNNCEGALFIQTLAVLRPIRFRYGTAQRRSRA